jgi:hypothetical protein
MEKRNVAEVKRTPCSFCGRPSDVVIGEKAACKLHVKLVKEGAEGVPLKDAAPGLAKEWNK